MTRPAMPFVVHPLSHLYRSSPFTCSLRRTRREYDGGAVALQLGGVAGPRQRGAAGLHVGICSLLLPVHAHLLVVGSQHHGPRPLEEPVSDRLLWGEVGAAIQSAITRLEYWCPHCVREGVPMQVVPAVAAHVATQRSLQCVVTVATLATRIPSCIRASSATPRRSRRS